MNRTLGETIAFALTAHWFSRAASFLLSGLNGTLTTGLFDRIFDMIRQNSSSIDVLSRRARWMGLHPSFGSWFKGVSSVVADPFFTCIPLFITSVFVFIGARLLIRAESQPRVTFESAIKIVAYMTSISVFSFIPVFGQLIAWLYSFYIGVIGARELYGASKGRAVMIILFPELLVWGVILAIMLVVALMMMGIFFSLIHF